MPFYPGQGVRLARFGRVLVKPSFVSEPGSVPPRNSRSPAEPQEVADPCQVQLREPRGRYPPPNEREPGKESGAREKRNKIDVLQLPAKRTARAISLPSSCAAALLIWGFLSHLSIAVKRAEFHQPLTGAGSFYYQPPERSCQSRMSFNTSNLQLLYTSAAAGWCGVSCAGARHLQKALGASWARSGESLGGSPCPLYAGGVRCLIRLAFPSRGRGEVSSLSKEHLSEARVPAELWGGSRHGRFGAARLEPFLVVAGTGAVRTRVTFHNKF